MADKFNGRIKPSAVTVAITATKIPTTPLPGRQTMVLKNNGAAVVYVGNSVVSSTNGYPIAPNAELGLDVGPDVDVYGRVVSGTVNVRILEGA